MSGAQSPDGRASPGQPTRAQLIQQARVADSLGRKEEAFLLRTRLRDGDFQVGDRVTVAYEGIVLTRSDSLVVQTGKLLHLGEPLGDLDLSGILRFELRDSISKRVARYFKNEVVNVTYLLRLEVTGAVRMPGFYYARPDVPLSDVLMRAGAQDQQSDLTKVVIKRGDQTVWHSPDVQAALSDGLTLARLDLEPGDQIVVGAKKTGTRWLTIATYSLPVFTAIVFQVLSRRR